MNTLTKNAVLVALVESRSELMRAYSLVSMQIDGPTKAQFVETLTAINTLMGVLDRGEKSEALQSADTKHEVGHADSLSNPVDVAGTVANAYAHGVAAAVKAGVFQGGDDGHIVGAAELALLQQECAHDESSFVGYAAKYAAKGQQDTLIGTRHTIKLCSGRAIAVQATRMGTVMLEIIDSNGRSSSVDAIALDPMTAGVLALAVEHSCEAIEADKARREAVKVAA